ncbi:MAG TPA: hypothetical protein VGS20_14915 [Candidatus Acidoferrales bacterium]|nr:hypothetical protein [Candidatus Acidoferrales bacterium]
MASRRVPGLAAVVAVSLLAASPATGPDLPRGSSVALRLIAWVLPLIIALVVLGKPSAPGAPRRARVALVAWYLVCVAAIKLLPAGQAAGRAGVWARMAFPIVTAVAFAGLFWFTLRCFGGRVARLTPLRMAAAALLCLALLLLWHASVRSPTTALDALAFFASPLVVVALFLLLLEHRA